MGITKHSVVKHTLLRSQLTALHLFYHSHSSRHLHTTVQHLSYLTTIIRLTLVAYRRYRHACTGYRL